MRSIEKQLNLSLAVSILLIFLIFWWLSVFTIHHLTEDYILTRLEHDTLSIEKHLNRSGQGHQMPAVDYDAINPIYAQPDSGHYFVIQLGDHLLKSLSLTDYPLYLKKALTPSAITKPRGLWKAPFWSGGSSATTKVNRWSCTSPKTTVPFSAP